MSEKKKIIREYFQPAFLICVSVLAISAIAMPIVINSVGVYLEKDPLPMRKSLDLLAGDSLGTYNITKGKIENKEIVEALGTEDYIQWTLEDTSVEQNSPLRYCTLFITYYDRPDRVPHVPEECYTGGGYQKIGTDTFSASYKQGEITKEIPVRYVIFDSTNKSLWENETKFSVTYFFSVNGVYCNSREDARFAINRNVFNKQLYFSKVEWKFFGKDRFGTAIFPKRELLQSGSEKLLGIIVPLLEDEYWPQVKK